MIDLRIHCLFCCGFSDQSAAPEHTVTSWLIPERSRIAAAPDSVTLKNEKPILT